MRRISVNGVGVECPRPVGRDTPTMLVRRNDCGAGGRIAMLGRGVCQLVAKSESLMMPPNVEADVVVTSYTRLKAPKSDIQDGTTSFLPVGKDSCPDIGVK